MERTKRNRKCFYEHDKLIFMTKKFTIGLLQMRSTANPDENLSRAIEKIREASARGAQIICMDELFRGDISAAPKIPSFQSCRTCSWTRNRCARENRKRTESCSRRFAVRTPRRRHLPQHLRSSPREVQPGLAAAVLRVPEQQGRAADRGGRPGGGGVPRRPRLELRRIARKLGLSKLRRQVRRAPVPQRDQSSRPAPRGADTGHGRGERDARLFSDGGRWFGADAAIKHGLDLVAQGADVVDVRMVN